MPVLPDDFAPYAPARNVLVVIHQFRERGLPDVITPQVLDKLGIPEGNIGRVGQALRFLGLTDEDGKRTESFDIIRQASTEQYPEVFAQIVRDAYHAVFQYIDPAVDTDIRIADQFRHFQPQSVRSRMVALFLELCREAEIISRASAPNSSDSNIGKARVRKPNVLNVPNNAKEIKQNKEQQKPADKPAPGLETEKHDANAGGYSNPRYQLLHAFLDRLPSDGKMTLELYEKWIKAFTPLLEYTIEIIEIEDEKQNRPQQPE